MGYCMNTRSTKFFMRSSDLEPALQAIKDLMNRASDIGGGASYRMGQTERFFSWVNTVEVTSSLTFVDAMRAWRWAVELDNDANAVDIEFWGEKLGDDHYLFEVIAPWVEEGSYIEMHGEDGAIWRWTFDGETCREVEAKVSFEA
jgi:hypothetical protein